MMNRYYGHANDLGSRSGRNHGCLSRAPYRRPMGHGNLPINPARSGGGCGCGLSVGNGTSPSRPVQSAGCPACAVTSANRAGSSCGQNQDHNACRKLMEKIRAVDFALYEIVLYLDVYPHSCDALDTYHKLKAQQTELYREYEALCGPLTAFGNESHTSWDWMSKPFPWEYDAD